MVKRQQMPTMILIASVDFNNNNTQLRHTEDNLHLLQSFFLVF